LWRGFIYSKGASFGGFLPGDYYISRIRADSLRLRGAPLPHSHNVLVATPCSVFPLQEGQVGVQESPHNTEGLPLFSRGAVQCQ
jgi:hypothetical protein